MSVPASHATSVEQRQGVLVRPELRLSEDQVRLIDGISRELLESPGLICYSRRATEIFRKAGCVVTDGDSFARISIPAAVLDKALKTAPSTVVLGARDPANRLVLDAHEPRVRFVSGSETNIWLDVSFDDDRPKFARTPGSIARLCQAAHLGENLENMDAFIRCVNIQDKDVTAENKDVNKFFASFNNISKHVQAGLTDTAALDDILRMGQMIAGGEEAFRQNPVFSLITCVIKSPFQMVEDTADTMIEISKRQIPLVISSCPMGGATGPFDEFGMVAQINAELLAGVALNQLVSPGAPVLYGAVPVRTRLDNLRDMYGAPEFVHYNIDCAQMARHYGLPCYSTAGVGDADVPGIQANTEKLMTLLSVPRGGAQYIHYAFGLLERTNVFCPEQAVMDDAHISIAKRMLAEPQVDDSRRQAVVDMIREVMESDHKTYVYHLPLPTVEPVYVKYPLEDEQGGALMAAHKKYKEIMQRPGNNMPDDLQGDILTAFPNILPQCRDGREANR